MSTPPAATCWHTVQNVTLRQAQDLAALLEQLATLREPTDPTSTEHIATELGIALAITQDFDQAQELVDLHTAVLQTKCPPN